MILVYGELEEYGFEVNPYDPCVANEIVNGSQMTVTWQVDDLKVSHKDYDEITKFLLFWGSNTAIVSRLLGGMCAIISEWT